MRLAFEPPRPPPLRRRRDEPARKGPEDRRPGRGRGECGVEPRGLSGSGAVKDSGDLRPAETDRAGTPARDPQVEGQGAPAAPPAPAREEHPDPDVLPVFAVLVDAVTGDWIGQPVPTGRQTTARD